MNTVQVGDSLEQKIFNLLSKEINEGRFFGNSSCCKIFRKKGYYSAAREKNIIFDVSIEFYLPNASNYSMLILVECKNYTHPVPVDDIEEFWAKAEQVGQCNTKAVLATNASLQSSAYNVAKSKGMGYLRYFGESEHKWELYRSPSASALSSSVENSDAIFAGLTNEYFQSEIFDLYMLSPARTTNVLWDFIEDLINDSNLEPFEIRSISNPPSSQHHLVPFIEKERLEELSYDVLMSTDYLIGEVNLTNICAQEQEKSGLTVLLNQPLPIDVKTPRCGQISFENLEIKIFTHTNPLRERFTLAHELAHHFLQHGKHMRTESCDESDFSIQRIKISNGSGISRMEFQANYFAASLLMPKINFLNDFKRLTRALELTNRGHGALFVDNQTCNVKNYEAITNTLMQRYSVSRAAIAIRLSSLGMLNDVRSFEPFSN
jgi:Zn-dependent peptidase ImmA (M78 family)